ncbi:6-phosphofructo-2-kinase [Mycoemilia scoparia]|uniref:6-phosphofructo-2-kinase n=1 Tax=Mycoemilia scoparia TaxID=417184 RepID=A0A9W8DNX1_9FUNG|nr:6-phosphofructo-2-kinase [Mycoemilia scoparia]
MPSPVAYNISPVPYLGSLHVPVQRYGPGSSYQEGDHKLVVIMVGLPARGKSYIVKKLKRYLSWLGFNTKIFNVGDRRRLVADDAAAVAAGAGASSIADTSVTATASRTDSGNIADAAMDTDIVPQKILQKGLLNKTNKSYISPEVFQRDGSPCSQCQSDGECGGRGRRHSSAFFDPNNEKARYIRNKVAMDVLEDLIRWLQSGGQIAIHDATNSTIPRRREILNRLDLEPDINVLFVESICNDQDIISRNIKLKTKGPDYIGVDPAIAEADFRARLKNYERAYTPLGDYEENRDAQYCKIVDVGKKVIAHNIQGYIESQCVFYLMNINLQPRIIFISRHGQSEDNVLGRIGGDAPLSAKGHKYAAALAKFIKQQMSEFSDRLQQQRLQQQRQKLLLSSDEKGFEHCEMGYDGSSNTNSVHEPDPEPMFNSSAATSDTSSVNETTQQKCEIWTSMLKRSMQTSAFFDPEEFTIRNLRALNEIYAGKREGMTYEEIKKLYPEEYEARMRNKFYYRYPGIGGESYADVVQKLQQIIVELERKRHSVTIISHRAMVRTLLSYFMDIPSTHMPDMDVPLGYVYACEPRPFGNHLTVWKYLENDDKFIKIDTKSALRIGPAPLMTPASIGDA